MNSNAVTQEMEIKREEISKLRDELAREQKCGLPFIIASVVIWGLITAVCSLDLSTGLRNIAVFCCSCPLMLIAMLAGKILRVDIFDRSNPLGKLGVFFTMNQMLYLLIAMWVFYAVPDKMLMVYAMIFGAHLFPYSWLYKSMPYLVSSIVIPIGALLLGTFFPAQIMSAVCTLYEIVFAVLLYRDAKKKCAGAEK